MSRIFIACIAFVLLFSFCSLAGQSDEMFTPKQLNEDLDFLIKTIEEVHPNSYAYVSKEEFDQHLSAIKKSINKPMTSLEFYKLIAPLVGILKDGHTFLGFPMTFYDDYSFEENPLFPLDLEIKDSTFFVKANYSNDSSIESGSEILSINSIPSGVIIDSLLQYTTGMKRSFKVNMLNRRIRTLMWTVFDFDKSCTAEIRQKSDGKVSSHNLSGVSFDTIMLDEQYQAPTKAKKYYSYRSMPEKKTGIIDFWSFSIPDQFDDFLQKTFKQIRDENTENLIIDIRENGGGDSKLGDMLLAYLAEEPISQGSSMDLKVSRQICEKYGFLSKDSIGKIISFQSQPKHYPDHDLHFNGQVYVLISPRTFSSAVMFATTIKDYGLGTIIGEETGGLSTSYGDIYSFFLPNTKLKAGVSHKHFIRPSGEDDGRGVIPDYEVKPSLPDDNTVEDKVMDFTLELISSNQE